MNEKTSDNASPQDSLHRRGRTRSKPGNIFKRFWFSARKHLRSLVRWNRDNIPDSLIPIKNSRESYFNSPQKGVTAGNATHSGTSGREKSNFFGRHGQKASQIGQYGPFAQLEDNARECFLSEVVGTKSQSEDAEGRLADKEKQDRRLEEAREALECSSLNDGRTSAASTRLDSTSTFSEGYSSAAWDETFLVDSGESVISESSYESCSQLTPLNNVNVNVFHSSYVEDLSDSWASWDVKQQNLDVQEKSCINVVTNKVSSDRQSLSWTVLFLD